MAQSTMWETNICTPVIDEVDAARRAKVREVLRYLYARLCEIEVYKLFECEGCQKFWSSQRDHECCIKSREEIFYDLYDIAKRQLNLDGVSNPICTILTEFVNIPMTSEWTNLVGSLPTLSPETVYKLCEKMDESREEEQDLHPIIDFVKTMCNTMEDPTFGWSDESYLRFKEFMFS